MVFCVSGTRSSGGSEGASQAREARQPQPRRCKSSRPDRARRSGCAARARWSGGRDLTGRSGWPDGPAPRSLEQAELSKLVAHDPADVGFGDIPIGPPVVSAGERIGGPDQRGAEGRGDDRATAGRSARACRLGEVAVPIRCAWRVILGGAGIRVLGRSVLAHLQEAIAATPGTG